MMPVPACAERGRGSRALVFLHGIGGNHRAFAPQLERFSGSARAIAWDMPGYGASPPLERMTFPGLAQALVALLDARGAEQAVVIRRGTAGDRGSPLFADRVAADDSVQVARLKAAGAIVVGKTNAPEFGAPAYTKNRIYGVTRSPWNLELTPGGSSGGSSAAMAAAVLPLVTAERRRRLDPHPGELHRLLRAQDLVRPRPARARGPLGVRRDGGLRTADQDGRGRRAGPRPGGGHLGARSLQPAASGLLLRRAGWRSRCPPAAHRLLARPRLRGGAVRRRGGGRGRRARLRAASVIASSPSAGRPARAGPRRGACSAPSCSASPARGTWRPRASRRPRADGRLRAGATQMSQHALAGSPRCAPT